MMWQMTNRSGSSARAEVIAFLLESASLFASDTPSPGLHGEGGALHVELDGLVEAAAANWSFAVEGKRPRKTVSVGATGFPA
jgi:hypothetical protein